MAKGIHDDMCARTAVVDVAEYVQLVDTEFLYHIAYGDDERLGLSCGYYGFDDAVEVSLLVILASGFMKKFFDYI